MRKDASLISITHTSDSGFVTMKKKSKQQQICNISKEVSEENKNAEK